MNLTGADLSGVDLRGAVIDVDTVLNGDETINSFKVAKGINAESLCVESYPNQGSVDTCAPLPKAIARALTCAAKATEAEITSCRSNLLSWFAGLEH